MKEEHKQKQMSFITSLRIDQIDFTDNTKISISHIGGIPFEHLSLDYLVAFCRSCSISISIPHGKRKKGEVPLVIANFIKAGAVKGKLTAAPANATIRKSGKQSTQPSWLTEDGTIYHMIIVITCEEIHPRFIRIKGSYTGAMLDSCKPHPESCDSLTLLFNSDKKEFDSVEEKAKSLIGYSVNLDISAT